MIRCMLAMFGLLKAMILQPAIRCEVKRKKKSVFIGRRVYETLQIVEIHYAKRLLEYGSEGPDVLFKIEST